MVHLFKKELKKTDHEDMTVVIYTITDDFEGCETETEDDNTKTNQQILHTEGDTTWGRCYTLIAVIVGPLCILLLTAYTLHWIQFNNLVKEKDQLQATYNNLASMRKPLQIRRNNIQDAHAKQGWRYFSFSLYYISAEEKTWTESRQDCIERGADLVIINSKEEQAFIIEAMGSYHRAWIGLSHRDRMGNWKWVDDTELKKGTGYWYKVEPYISGNSRTCIEIWMYPGAKGWNNRSCSEEQLSICEKSAF